MGEGEHRAAVRAAVRAARGLEGVFGRMGTVEHPRGRVLGAYRNARRALADVWGRGAVGLRWEVEEVLGGLRREVTAAAVDLLGEAAALGMESGQRQVEGRGLEAGWPGGTELGPALGAWLAPMDAQVAAVRGVAAMGGGIELVVGDEESAGILTPGPVVREGGRWLAWMAMAGWQDAVGAGGRGSGGAGEQGWFKQAVAAIDERTTDCCLRVHGQAVPLEADFRLTADPRYADEMQWSPFHWWCRTSVALVTADEVGDDVTDWMRGAADAELARRAALLEEIKRVKGELGRLGAAPDVRHRAGDSAAVTGLRDELRRLREELEEEQHPASGVGG